MLYTGKGDQGTTKTFGCNQSRISKSSELPEALGTLDELNAFLGLCKVRARELGDPVVLLGKKKFATSVILHEVQENLFIIQAEVAGAAKKIRKTKVTHVENMVNTIETMIPPVVSFSIAGGTELSALLDVARTLSRRAERRLVGVHEANLRKISDSSRAYANRLSSLLFALARFANTSAGVKEQNPSYR